MPEAPKSITAIFTALFLNDFNILMGEPSDILASQFLILLTSSDFHFYLLILLVTLRILSSLAIVPSPKLTFYAHLLTYPYCNNYSVSLKPLIHWPLYFYSSTSVFMSPLTQLWFCGPSLYCTLIFLTLSPLAHTFPVFLLSSSPLFLSLICWFNLL